MPSATIRIFLVHGDPKRLRTAELSNWTGKAVAGPRSEFEGLLTREEAGHPGVYFLSGSDPETGKAAIYIGEAECIRDRIKMHLSKDFWNHLVFFISKDENLTKAHIKFLEGRLIGQAQAAGRAVVMNVANSGAKLPESDREDMEIFMEKIRQLLPVMGIDFLTPPGVESGSKRRLLFCKFKGLHAEGRLATEGFVVLKNSEAVLVDRPSAQKYVGPRDLRARLRSEGALVKQGNRLVFTRDVEFASPSAAASVIQGGHANGLIAWKDKGGKTLKGIESEG